MSQASAPTALLCLAPGDERNALRAAMMAMNVLPQDLLPNRDAMEKLARALHADSRAVAFIDLTAVRPVAAHGVALAALLPLPEMRSRVTLLQSQWGVWQTERTWAKELGFADLVAQIDTASLATEAHPLLDWVAAQTRVNPISSETLTRYFSGMQVKSDASSPRGTIRKTTGLTAEALCTALGSNVKALNRVYHLKSYPSCFLGTEAVAWLMKQYTVSKDTAIGLGGALQKLGMLHHVSHEHAFTNEAFFYRTALSSDVDRLSLSTMLRLLNSSTGLEVRDRLYHAVNYPACFVGSEAVDWLHKNHKLQRHDAETLLNRLHGLNLIAHVSQAHAVRDGFFFYRFVA